MSTPVTRPPRPEFSRPMAVEPKSVKPRTFAIEADEAERAALARRFGLVALDELRAEGTLETRDGGAAALLTARFVARLSQPCVVTLEPVPEVVEEDFVLDYAVPGAGVVDPKDIDIDVEEADPPEPLVNGIVDLGEAVAEHLALALDPYPRAPGVEFTPPEPVEERANSPFKALSGLLKKDKT